MVLLVLLAAGILALVAGSGGLRVVGGVVVGVVLLVTAAGAVGDRFAGFSMTPKSTKDVEPLVDEPADHPQYIEKAAEPSEDVWAHEEQEYRERQAERERENRPDG